MPNMFLPFCFLCQKKNSFETSKNVFYFTSKALFIFVIFRSSHPEVFLRKGVLKICSKCTGEHPCRSAISVKLQSNFIKIPPCHGCSPVNLLHIFRTPFPKNTSGWLLLDIQILEFQNLKFYDLIKHLSMKQEIW